MSVLAHFFVVVCGSLFHERLVHFFIDIYNSGHIPGAVLLPVGSIDETTAAEVIPEKDSTVLVYCRSGNRSKTASSTLAELGYTSIYEFGGINTWSYETEP